MQGYEPVNYVVGYLLTIFSHHQFITFGVDIFAKHFDLNI